MAKSIAVLSAAFGFAHASQHLRSFHQENLENVAPTKNLDGGLVKPLKFNQPLLLCNAYDSKSGVAVTKNGDPMVADLPFQACKYADANVLAKDKIDFNIVDAGIEGTFEIGDLPQTDSVLLLVLQKRDSRSPLMSFQSFAFPTNGAKGQAHVAVIDASSGSHKAHLQIGDKPLQGDVRRNEELSFNRVYALEEGAYDISVLDQGQQPTGKQEIELFGQKDYVLLRTNAISEGASTLVAFPHDVPMKSGSSKSLLAVSVAVAMLAAVFSA